MFRLPSTATRLLWKVGNSLIKKNIDNNHTIIIKLNFCRRDSENVSENVPENVSMSTRERFLHHAEVKTDKDSPGVAR